MSESGGGAADAGTIADYRLIRSLGRANNGELYLSTPPARLGLEVEFIMVKVLDGAIPADTLRRATRELRAFASVESPFLVTLYDAGQEGQRMFYAMEYLPLGSFSTPRVELTYDIVMAAVADAARAAHALHEGGMAHGDIQPANVLITETGGKLADLGLSQVFSLDANVTGAGTIRSLEHMDIQVLHGAAPSRASDVWALGTTLHRGLTGQGVYGELPEDQPLTVIRRVLSTIPALSDSLAPAARAVIERCLRPEASDRYGTAAEVADALDGCR